MVWWKGEKGKGKMKGKNKPQAPATIAGGQQPVAASTSGSVPDAASTSTSSTPAVAKATAPKAAAKSAADPTKRVRLGGPQSGGSMIAIGKDFSATFSPAPGKLVVPLSISSRVQALGARIEGSMKGLKSEKVQVHPLIDTIADISLFHSERAFNMFTEEVNRAAGNQQTIDQDPAFMAEYKTVRDRFAFTNLNAGWLSRSLGNLVLESGERVHSAGPGFVPTIPDLAVGPVDTDPTTAVQRFNLPAGYAGQETWLSDNLVPLELLVYLKCYVDGNCATHIDAVNVTSTICYPAGHHGNDLAAKFLGLERLYTLALTPGGQAVMAFTAALLTPVVWEALISGRKGQSWGLWASPDFSSGLKKCRESEAPTHGIRNTLVDSISYVLDPAHLVLKDVEPDDYGYQIVNAVDAHAFFKVNEEVSNAALLGGLFAHPLNDLPWLTHAQMNGAWPMIQISRIMFAGRYNANQVSNVRDWMMTDAQSISRKVSPTAYS